jgi:putative DNA primase/helicase
LAGDISNQPIQDSDLVKSITSGEEITIEQKYKQAQSKALFSTLFFACNKLPRTPDTTDGFYRRWTIIPFIADLSQVTRVQGMHFKKALLAQDSLDYVAYKAIQAIYRVLTTTQDFTEPQAVKDMMHQYKVDNSTILSWYAETFDSKTKLEKLSTAEAYISYTNWCGNSGRVKSSITTFSTAVRVDIGVEFKDKK